LGRSCVFRLSRRHLGRGRGFLLSLGFGYQVADLLAGFGGNLGKYLHNQAYEINPGSPYPLLQKLNFFGLKRQKFFPKPFFDPGG
jgi:hypothetical protein